LASPLASDNADLNDAFPESRRRGLFPGSPCALAPTLSPLWRRRLADEAFG